jgi:hypothetical protein
MAGLLPLSLHRVGRRVPSPPSNDERLAAYREKVPPMRGNNHPWQWRQDDVYARAEAADGREPTTDVHYLEWTK